VNGRAAKDGRLSTRTRPRPSDLRALRRLVESTGVFYREEIEIAIELLEERLRRGRSSGYEFIFAERGGELLGYCVWGAVPLTKGSYDLYWIAVAPEAQGLGLGRHLMHLAECEVAKLGGGRLYIETSSRAAYVRTRRFYRAAGYKQAARLPDFYARGDHKVVFYKTIARAARRRREVNT
jgi:ribosomal protein S18 acetylase RimI-like enzyme